MSTNASAGPTVGDVGEFALIDTILAAAPAPSPNVVVGPGDDSAVFAVPMGSVTCSTDAMVEGVHFKRDWSSANDIGRKAAAVNIADIEAMGATPRGLLIALCAPPELPVGWVEEFRDGVLAECATASVELLGGDTSASPVLTIVVTAMGDLEGREPITRAGARPGQHVAMMGRLGWAAAGLRTLSRGFRSPRVVVDAQRCPEVPYGFGRRASEGGATSMIDVSDGLLADLGHIAAASGVSIDITSASLEIAEPLRAVAAATGGDPLHLVLAGGEDHALVGTFDTVPDGWVAIGTVAEPGAAGVSVTVDGAVPEITGGHDHFAKPPRSSR
ncbi:thiamine-phosphate kinase [Propionibacteriaceae bacterium Y2011]|uniref:thiamine-phosphate kinase n=1 Tax=Microlunatus sp. Y2014 TaxID=3418488 RepID=UPI003B4ADE2D